MLIERGRALEAGAAEPQAVGARRIGREPFGVDVEHEEDRAVLHIGGDKIVWFPGVDGNNGVFCEKPSLVADVDPGRCSTDMKTRCPSRCACMLKGRFN